MKTVTAPVNLLITAVKETPTAVGLVKNVETPTKMEREHVKQTLIAVVMTRIVILVKLVISHMDRTKEPVKINQTAVHQKLIVVNVKNVEP
jgi:hypothetical protein